MSHESKTDWRPSASLEAMKSRARMLQSIRAFFAEQQVLEVETPVLSSAAITDPHLHSFKTTYLNRPLYLHTSPEFFMKRLLAAGSGDIYQICKVFRDDEQGQHHNPEFSMLEWYRLDFDHHRLMDEMEILLMRLVTRFKPDGDEVSFSRLSYRQAFINALDIDPLMATAVELKQAALRFDIEIPQGMDESNKDMWLDWLMTQKIATSFSRAGFTFLFDYPASQAALARLSTDDPRIAHRFELFFGEHELANGFYELTDAGEQRDRFESENSIRSRQGMAPMPVDGHLLEALAHGLPPCAGVAIGLDRLLMVLLEISDISDVLSFDFNRV